VVEIVLGLAVLAAVGWIGMIVAREVLRRGAPARLEARIRTLDAAREGGAPDRPIEVVSPAQIEPRAERAPCPRCSGNLHVEAHEVDGPELLRRVLTRCGQCGEHVTTWFRVLPPQPD
jgi:hypothetical protein